MRRVTFGAALAMALAVLAIGLTTPRSANASIHEIIAAACRAGGEEVVPFGQNKDGQSFLRALQATGFIESIDTSDPSKIVIHFNPDVPNSKFRPSGEPEVVIELTPELDLVLIPGIELDPEFAAHANCNNLN